MGERESSTTNLIYDTRHVIHGLPLRKLFVFLSFFFLSYSFILGKVDHLELILDSLREHARCLLGVSAGYFTPELRGNLHFQKCRPFLILVVTLMTQVTDKLNSGQKNKNFKLHIIV